MSVSRETEERLALYEVILRRWNSRINLVSPKTLDDLRFRHIDDSFQLAELAAPEAGEWVDFGSGGGLPGMVVAIACAETPVKVRLVESDQRKAAFLRTVIRELDLGNADVICDRIESIKPLTATFISARALAPLPFLMPYLDRHLAEDGQAWLMKGERWQSEVDDARRHWKFDLISYPSRTHSSAAILRISGLSNE